MNGERLCLTLALCLGGCAAPGPSDNDEGRGGKADEERFGSCENSCGRQSANGNCWCDDQCTSFGDCCGDKASVCDPQGGCADRTAGAFVTIRTGDEKTIKMWITDHRFIDTAVELVKDPAKDLVPTFEVLLGSDCDLEHSWHVDPVKVEWSESAIELCDATLSYIDENPQRWIDEVRIFCPWTAQVVSVEDRRAP